MSETTFTATSGKKCQFDTSTGEDGVPFATVVWLGTPTEADIEEFNVWAASETGRVVDCHLLGSITEDQMAQAREIGLERWKEQQ